MFSGEPLLPKMPSHLSASSPFAASLVKSLTIPAFHGVKGGEAAFLDEYLDIPNHLPFGLASKKQDATKREVFFSLHNSEGVTYSLLLCSFSRSER